jgi:hypothetical protein
VNASQRGQIVATTSNILHNDAYNRGVYDFKSGGLDVNPFCKTDIRYYCAWSAGYFDAKRGFV